VATSITLLSKKRVVVVLGGVLTVIGIILILNAVGVPVGPWRRTAPKAIPRESGRTELDTIEDRLEEFGLVLLQRNGQARTQILIGKQPPERRFVVDFEHDPSENDKRPIGTVVVKTWQVARDELIKHVTAGVSKDRFREAWTFTAHGDPGILLPLQGLCTPAGSVELPVPDLSIDSLRPALKLVPSAVGYGMRRPVRNLGDPCFKELQEEFQAIREILVLCRENLSRGGVVEFAVCSLGADEEGHAFAKAISQMLPGTHIAVYTQPVAWKAGRLYYCPPPDATSRGIPNPSISVRLGDLAQPVIYYTELGSETSSGAPK
jgi:hypothetical protein